MKKIVFVLTHVPNPRINKRLSLCQEFASVFVVCARRKSQDSYEPSVNGIPHFIYDIDLPSSKHLFKRAIVSAGFQQKALKKIEELKPDIIYAEGLDPLIIANKYKESHSVKVFFEVADLRECFLQKPGSIIEKIKAYLISKKEKKNIRSIERLIVTSEKFYEMHYNQMVDKDKVIFIPNVPDLKPFDGFHKKNDGDFTIGFIGGIRYISQMKMLVDVAEQADCNVLFAGAGGTSNDYETIKLYCKDKQNISFTGKYDYNSQIAELYSRVDCVYSVYDASNPNVKIALPNKLYEAVLCELPIIVAKGTYLSDIVEKYGLGASVGCLDYRELYDAIVKLRDERDFYNRIVNNCQKNKNEILAVKVKYQILQNALEG